jgi:RHS repeat-associated protein
LSGATINRVVSGQSVVIATAYQYNPDGIRTRSDSTTTTNGVVTDQQSNLLVIDGNNPTGYAQVIEELTVQRQLLATTIYGLEPISQWRSAMQSFYHMDGHSGVRLLTNLQAAVIATYSFDGYGQLLRSGGNVANPLLYRGERFDSILAQYYLRARFYDPATGRFIAMDRWPGSASNPLRQAKYAFCNNDGINCVDPSGFDWSTDSSENGATAHWLFSLYILVKNLLHRDSQDLLPSLDFPLLGFASLYWALADAGAGKQGAWAIMTNPFAWLLKPDVISFSNRLYIELKPNSSAGRAAGIGQMAKYDSSLGPTSNSQYSRGNQFGVVNFLTPIGIVKGKDQKYYIISIEPAPGDRAEKGLVYYRFTRLPDGEDVPQPTPVPAPGYYAPRMLRAFKDAVRENEIHLFDEGEQSYYRGYVDSSYLLDAVSPLVRALGNLALGGLLIVAAISVLNSRSPIAAVI